MGNNTDRGPIDCRGKELWNEVVFVYTGSTMQEYYGREKGGRVE